MANIFFIAIGLVFILLSIILLLIFFLHAKSKNEMKSYSFGFILLGPFPIFFSSRRLVIVVLMIILIFITFIIVTFMGVI